MAGAKQQANGVHKTTRATGGRKYPCAIIQMDLDIPDTASRREVLKAVSKYFVDDVIGGGRLPEMHILGFDVYMKEELD